MYNEEEDPLFPAEYVAIGIPMKMFCTVKHFLDESYGKFGEDNVDDQIIMEYNEFFPYMNTYLPNKLQNNAGFIEWLSEPKRLE